MSTTLRARAAAVGRALGPLLGLIACWALFASLVGPAFSGSENQRLMLLQTAVVGTAAVGATLVIVSGGIDLSVGSSIALATMIVALLLRAGAPGWLAVLGGVACGTACGGAIGLLVVGRLGWVAGAVAAGLLGAWVHGRAGAIAGVAAGAAAVVPLALGVQRAIGRLELSPFIVTLGMWGALRGLAKGVGGNQPIYPDELHGLDALMHGGHGLLPPPGGWIFLGAALVLAFVLRSTRLGRHACAIGSNESAARLCGVDVPRTKVIVYAIAGACAGLAGVLQFAYLTMGDPTTAGGAELRVIAAVVIGGASLTGGEGSILGTIVGALIMTTVDSGCTKLGLSNWVQEVVTGAIIVAAVAIDRKRRGVG